jgi:hypothetical protein
MMPENEKTQNKLRLTNLTLQSLTKGVWEFVGDTAFAMTQVMGEDILKVLEQDMGLKIQGQNPKEVVDQIGRIMVEKFGVIENYECNLDSNQKITIKVKSCIQNTFCQELYDAGITKPFICPHANACQAALRRLKLKVSRDIQVSPTGDCTYSFEIMP